MQVKKLMIGRVASCPSHENLERAAQVMCELDCGCVPIIDSGAKVVGMLTDRDICGGSKKTDDRASGQLSLWRLTVRDEL